MLVLSLALILSGCQLTASDSASTDVASNNVEQQLDGASPSDINDALMINACIDDQRSISTINRY